MKNLLLVGFMLVNVAAAQQLTVPVVSGAAKPMSQPIATNPDDSSHEVVKTPLQLWCDSMATVNGQPYVGNKYVVKDDVSIGAENRKSGESWECIEVRMNDFYLSINDFSHYDAILKNASGEVIKVSLESMNEPEVFETAQASKYKTKFGATNWGLILQGRVKVGMTAEMCRLSWGKPSDVNTTITASERSEQWVYSDSYLYFDNGVLTTIQN